MAGNFWQSSHNQQWILDKQDLVRERQHDLAILTEEEYQKIFIFFSSVIQTLGEQLKLRQQVIATATVYFKRFYARNSLKCIDPLLLAPTCIFLASKVEEFGVISNSRLISTCQTVIKNKFGYAYTQEFPYRTNHILECEFYLLENLDCCLIVYQPYRPLLQLVQDIGHEEQLLTLAWRIVNDSLRTDVCLLYPPYQIAIGCLGIACVILQKDQKSWFAELNVDLEKIQEIARYVMNLFELWKTYDEKKEIQALLGDPIVKNTTLKTPLDEDYYLSYDYEISSNSSSKDIKPDSLILPNPENMELNSPASAVDVLPDIELPDDSLADPDLKDHNCIDNIMYVYYGGNGKNTKSYGTGIIIIGSVMSCAAQLLTLFCVLLKKYYKGRKISMMLIVVHIYLTMFLSNLIFMLGVYSTKNSENCLLIAILINIFHHHTAIWIFLYCLYIYKKFCRTWVSVIFKNINWYTLITHLLPPLITITTYYAIPKSFETKKFCFKSMHRGMILNFMIPICVLLILTTIYAISAMIKIENLEVAKLDYHYQSESLQALNTQQTQDLESLKDKKDESISYVDEELQSLKATRNCLKSLCVMQLMFVLNWFITPVALDASHDATELPYLQSTTSMLLNWFVFYKRKTLLPLIDYAVEECSEQEKLDDDLPSSSATEVVSITSSDSIPLLKSDDSATELKEFCCNYDLKDCANDYNNISSQVIGEEYNDTPIIGVLSQETYIISSYFPNATYDSYIAASYVKYLESAGARVVPIWIGQNEDYYRRVVQYTNGLFFPGGGTYFNETGGYGEAATQLYKIALEYNNKGVYYPVWGTCLGMQVLMYAALSGIKDIRVDCNLRNVAVPLDFVEDYKKSRMFRNAPQDIIDILKQQNTTYNLHRYCLTKSVLKENDLLDEWKILTTNKDINGFEFISAMEHKDFPFYGIQFHPEKNQFEFKRNKGFPHTFNSIKVAQYFANFFVNECRKNGNSFSNEVVEADSLIYNFNPKYTGLKSGYYEQLYVFLKEDFERHQMN
ncbi:unnamed protein product [Ceutorhynchus assimilis]|uniref:folate gamma-glutamyl hydrolase n=1 Tax=Ceutorhynchus assimilis TaxID=467358 RepID=A0A9N9MTL1_9CUCU|nr:unnamed protein product [Ceutorhynchus assimilis]